MSESDDAWQTQREALGSFLRTQRQMARLSLRQLADLAKVSNPYLSQLERGLHAPSMRVLQSIADALDLSLETVLAQAGLLPPDDGHATVAAVPVASAATETAIRADPLLSDEQKDAMISVYRSYVRSSQSASA